MAYGVDQCRRCGKAMKVNDPNALRRYQESLTQKPTMTREQWKAAGWKAAPTHYQRHKILDGVCFDCRPIVVAKMKNTSAGLILMVMAAVLIGIFTIVYLLTAIYN